MSNTALACVRTSFCFRDLVSHFGIVSRPHREAASLRPLPLPVILILFLPRLVMDANERSVALVSWVPAAGLALCSLRGQIERLENPQPVLAASTFSLLCHLGNVKEVVYMS